MVLVSGPPFGDYPPEKTRLGGTRDYKFHGKRAQNIFDIKKEIFERENKNFRTLDFYRLLVKQMLSSFSDAQIISVEGDVNPVPVWYANYERAIAKIFEDRNLKIPAMTVALSETEEDLARRRPNFDIEFWTIKDVAAGRATRVASLAPKAVNVSFLVNIWTRYVEDMNQIMEYIQQKFHPHLSVDTDFDDNACAFLTGISENSVLDAPDREDRIIRKTVTFSIETYMPSRQYLIQSNGDIEILNYEVTTSAAGAWDSAVTENLTERPIRGTN